MILLLRFYGLFGIGWKELYQVSCLVVFTYLINYNKLYVKYLLNKYAFKLNNAFYCNC